MPIGDDERHITRRQILGAGVAAAALGGAAAPQVSGAGAGIVRSGVPEKLTPGYWNVACQCCGSAAVTELFLSLWLATGKTAYRDA